MAMAGLVGVMPVPLAIFSEGVAADMVVPSFALTLAPISTGHRNFRAVPVASTQAAGICALWAQA